MPLRLEDLTPDAQVTGLIGREAVRIVSAQMMGEACDLVFRDGQGNPHHQTCLPAGDTLYLGSSDS